MARLESVAIGGYYPTPDVLLPRIASLLDWPEGSARAVLLDPCAGSGEAIAALRAAWTDDPDAPYRSGPRVVATELEAGRARDLASRLDFRGDQALHGDAFRLVRSSTDTDDGVSLLYLNPPYDTDPEFRRLEHRFLTRFADFLAPGGVLLFLVPHRALSASASLLGRHFVDLRGWRFPPEHFAHFGQVLVAGRRRPRPLEVASHAAARILRWAEDPSELPDLPEACPDPFRMPEPHWHRVTYDLAEIDLTAALRAFRPWPADETGGDLPARELLGSRFPVVLPPKPAHLALALAAGMFNGHRLDPDDPRRLPPVLAKGAYSRESVEIDEKTAPDGTVSVTAVDRPRLTVTLLRLDTLTFHELAQGTEPAGGDDLARWTAADLLVNYGASMAALLREQFPALHNPADPAHQIALPRLARRPYEVQRHAVQAALKLLASGGNPFFTAEVGTGKTTMALTVAAALSPEHHAATADELRRLGFETPPPLVRRTLVLCPPHLLGSWRDQAAAVVPKARVQIVRDASDLDADAAFYVLSRERAKLGHGHRGVEGLCPRCGTALGASARANAARRLQCTSRPRRPANLAARLALQLAAILAPTLPDDDLVASLAPRRLLHRAEQVGPTPLSLVALDRCRDSVLHRLADVLRPSSGSVEPYGAHDRLLPLLEILDQAAGRSVDDLARDLEALAAAIDHEPAAAELRNHLSRLAERQGYVVGAPEELLLSTLDELHEAARWHVAPACGEALFQAEPPRRVPLARTILRHHRRRFDLVVLDEAHEYNNPHSAQAKAAHRLTGLPGVPTLVLTGSLMGGYASSLFPNFWALSPLFRREFDRDQAGEFVARYGYQKVRLTYRGSEGSSRRGAHTDRELAGRKVVGEAPGVHPLFLMRHLLSTAITVHKSDLEAELPPLAEEPVPLDAPLDDPMARELLAGYRRLQHKLLARIREDQFKPERSGRLLGALVELPSYLDRASDELRPFVLRYPDSLGGEHIATGASFPAAWRTPKERWLVGELASRIATGERVIVFLRHTRTRLARRLLRLIRSVAPQAVWLETSKVPTGRREAWIDEHVNAPGAPVLLVNPNAVRTGLNNLVGFSTAIWYELDYSAATYRQAIGRLHRIGQTRPVTILLPFYRGTGQEIAFDLVARKVGASLQVDGLDVRAALEAAGAGDGLPDGLDAALSLGRAVYRALVRQAA